MQKSDLSERLEFWDKVMLLSKERYPTDEDFKEATVRDLIDLAFDIHKQLEITPNPPL